MAPLTLGGLVPGLQVGFGFDVEADNPTVVADEMVSELCITKEQHIQVVDFIQDAVKRHSTGLMPLTSAVVSMNCANPPGTGAQLGSHQVRR